MTNPKDNPGYGDAQYMKQAAQELADNKKRTYELMRVKLGQAVLDVGCGPGSDTIPMAHIVGAEGRVEGIDYDQEMLDSANQKAEQEGVSDWVTHQLAEATQLPFDDNTFDSCRSERVFQHLLDPEAVLAEMIRVTKPGGWIVIFDADWSSVSVDTQEIDIGWKIRRFTADHNHNGYSGRRLYGQFKLQKLQEVSTEVINWQSTNYDIADQLIGVVRGAQNACEAGIITEDERDRWVADLQRARDEDRFFVYICGISVVGRKSKS